MSTEVKHAVTARVIRAMKAHGLAPVGWQVRTLTNTLLANDDVPSDEHVTEALMKADWFPKPRHRQWRVGEAGWRVRS